MTPEEFSEMRDAYIPLAAAVDFDDYGPADVPGGTFEYLGKYVRLSSLNDKQVASLIGMQFVNVCATAKAAGVPFNAQHIGNMIAEALVTHGGFHRADQCFVGMEPPRELPPSNTPIYDQMTKEAIDELVEDDDEGCIGIDDMTGWIKEGLFLSGVEGSFTEVTDPTNAYIHGRFDLEAVAEYLAMHIWEDDEEEDDE